MVDLFRAQCASGGGGCCKCRDGKLVQARNCVLRIAQCDEVAAEACAGEAAGEDAWGCADAVGEGVDLGERDAVVAGERGVALVHEFGGAGEVASCECLCEGSDPGVFGDDVAGEVPTMVTIERALGVDARGVEGGEAWDREVVREGFAVGAPGGVLARCVVVGGGGVDEHESGGDGDWDVFDCQR